MDLWLVSLIYLVGLGMIVAETFLPGVVIGLVGFAALATSVVFGFQHHWGIGAGQTVLALVIVPVAFFAAAKRLGLKASLAESVSFAVDYSAWLGKEGEAQMDLRPAGLVLIGDRRIDVVTAGELIPKGSRVRVVKVEGNRVVVKAL